MIPPQWPFALHAAIETAAAASFILTPEKQLPGCSPAAELILRQYGGLLLSSNLVCLAVIFDPSGFGDTSRLMAAALGTYHAWPCYRAYVRLRSSRGGITRPRHEDVAPSSSSPSTLGGPAVHLAVHSICFGMFMFVAASGDGSN